MVNTSTYFYYEKTHCIVIMGVCDANYKFILTDLSYSNRLETVGDKEMGVYIIIVTHSGTDFELFTANTGSLPPIK